MANALRAEICTFNTARSLKHHSHRSQNMRTTTSRRSRLRSPAPNRRNDLVCAPQKHDAVPQRAAADPRGFLKPQRRVVDRSPVNRPRVWSYRMECFSKGTVSSLAAASSRNHSSCPVCGRTRAAGRRFSSLPSKMRCWMKQRSCHKREAQSSVPAPSQNDSIAPKELQRK